MTKKKLALLWFNQGDIMTRPKGSKDKSKRKRKTILAGTQERKLVQDYENGVSIKELMQKYNVTKNYISIMFKGRKVKKRIDHSIVKSWEKISNLDELSRNICGVYAIYFVWNYNNNDPDKHYKINNIKLYIGSSTNIKKRLQDHAYHLAKKDHYSQNMQEWYSKNNYSIKYAIIERCDSKEIMQKERGYLAKWSKCCLLNSFFPTDGQSLKPWLQEAITRRSYCENYQIDELTGCKESLSVRKDGYGAIAVVVPGKGKKYLLKHRVAYWVKTGQYPELVRHICNNPKCYNGNHLIAGNHRDNALDKRGDFPKEFEAKWKEYEADVVRLSEYFESRWKRNCDLGGEKVSYLVYDWEKKLNLKEKYPEIISNNKNRRANKIV